MLPVIPKPPITPRQKAAAVAIAGFADLLQLALIPALGLGYVLDDFIDFVTAGLLVAICGFKWQFLLAFAFELVPALDLLPTWTAVALLLPTSPPAPVGAQRVTANPPGQYPPVDVTAAVVPPVQEPRLQDRT